MREDSPIKGKPYIEINPSRGGINSAGPGETLQILVRNLRAGLAIDERPGAKGNTTNSVVRIWAQRTPDATAMKRGGKMRGSGRAFGRSARYVRRSSSICGFNVPSPLIR